MEDYEMKSANKTIRSFTKGFLCVLISAGVLLSAAACGGGNESEQTDDTTNVQKDIGTEIPVIVDGDSDYQVVYPAGIISPTKKIYTNFKSYVRSATGFTFNMVADTTEQVDKEILIGLTNRPASADAYAKLGKNQFSFSLSGNSIVIAAYDDNCMDLALETFAENFGSEDKLSVFTGSFPVTYQCDDEFSEVVIDNTRNIEGDDPYVINHDGYYYYCWSSGGVMVAQISNLNNIVKDGGKQVFSASQNGFDSVWAPELHYIDGNWYIYVAMCKGTSDNAMHRMYCLKGTSQDPTDPFELVGQVTDPTNKWAIDGTVFKYHDELYTVWSGWQGDTDGIQNLYIAHMSNPWTIDSERVLISAPTTWDGITKNPSVNEGPCAIVCGDTVYILYSGNGSWTDDYCIGYLSCSDGDLLNASSWKKYARALLTKSEQIYGPGHCSVTTADDGSYQLIYHANLVSGTGWSGRSVRVQKLLVSENGIALETKKALESTLPVFKKKILVGIVEE
ncbi:MAG: family 43 glycosylhydrolase [Eubacteriales bacterium]